MALLTISSAVKPTSDSVIVRQQAGGTITEGDAVYLKSSDGKVYPADADAGNEEAEVYGIALNDAVLDEYVGVITEGSLVTGGTMVAGELYMLSSTPGRVQDAPSHTTGNRPSVVYAATSTTVAKLTLGFNTVVHT